MNEIELEPNEKPVEFDEQRTKPDENRNRWNRTEIGGIQPELNSIGREQFEKSVKFNNNFSFLNGVKLSVKRTDQ